MTLATSAGSTVGLIGTDRVRVDGASLNTVLVRPAGLELADAPLLLWRTPYGTAQHLSEAFGWASRGYVVVLQDVRGRFASSGLFEPYRHEASDGVATVNWLRHQGLTGPLVGYGGSYAAHCVTELAGRVPLAAALITVPAVDHDACIRERSGTPRLYAHALWWAEHGDTGVPRGPVVPALLAADPDALAGLPVTDLPARWGLKLPGFAAAWQERPGPPAGVSALLRRLEQAPHPAPALLCVGGWRDAFTDDVLDLWAGWPHRDATALIGAWGHALGLAPEPPSAIPTSSAHAVPLAELMVGWLDQTLSPQASNGPPPGRSVLSAARTLDGSDAGPPWARISVLRQVNQTWDLTVTARRFNADPERPHPSRLGQVDVTDLLPAGEEADSLACWGPVLTKPATLLGRPVLQLSGLATESTGAGVSVDWVVRLVAVLADGTAVQLSTECVRTAAAQARIELPAVHLHLPSGSRLVVQVSGHQFPLYPRDPHDGSDPLTATSLRPAWRRIDGPAQLGVPLLPPDVVAATGRATTPTWLRPERTMS